MAQVLIVGSGIAGLTCALAAVSSPARHDVVIVTKSTLDDTATARAQGGIAGVVGDPSSGLVHGPDSVASHVEDTLAAGAGLSVRDAVEVLCGEGGVRILDLIARGTHFDEAVGGALGSDADEGADEGAASTSIDALARGLEAAHSHPRILHALGDATGLEIQRALSAAVRRFEARGSIRILEHAALDELAVSDGRVVGAMVHAAGSTSRRLVPADAVVLATGGAGQLFEHTSNPGIATGDGIAAAFRAGAVLADLEFVQFHPTVLAVPGGALVSEALRGAGAVLLDERGERFLVAVHPDAELGPRDVVARGIAEQMARQDGRPVLLDATGLSRELLERRFPGVLARAADAGLDVATQPIPVTPAAHYLMGGIATDTSGRTSLPGLYAAGEAACTGVHGANRLASNSLLEGAVFGHRLAFLLGGPARAWDAPAWAADTDRIADTRPDAHPSRVATSHAAPFSRAALQHLMWEHAGLFRSQEGLGHAQQVLAAWHPPAGSGLRELEDTNLLLLARLTVEAALARRESRGAHFRTDFPATDPTPRHTVSATRELALQC